MWGNNDCGQLGDGTKTYRDIPVKIMDNVVSISTRWDSSGAITRDGSLYMWGCNDYGQLGDGTKTDRDIPVKIMDNVVSVSVGRYASGAITKDRSLYMWGYNAWGQLGNGTIVDEVIPVKVLDDVVAVGTNGATSAAITSNGDLYMWGVDIYGYEPTKIMSNVRDIKFGDDCYGIIKEDGSLYMWGCNDYGQLGDGTTEGRYVPDVPVKIMDNVRNVIMGEYNINGAITNNGELYLWGTGHLEPVRIMDNVLAASISMTLYLNSGVLTKDGRLYEWDDNDMMAFGAPTVEITIPGGVALPSAISAQSEESSSDSVPVLTASPDSTQPVSESEAADQSEEFEEEAVSVYKADATETNTATATQTASFKNLTPNDTYNFYVARSLTADDLLASDNILDIRQAVAGEDGRMSVTYQPRETDDNAVIFVVGSTPKDLSGAQITIGNTTYNGTAKSVTAAVECDGKTLVEGRDYLVTGGFEITGLGTYTLTIIGTGIYTGTASKTYTVTCQHNYTESITKQPTCTEPGRKTLTCSICGAVKDTTSIPKTAHTYKNKKVTKRATTSKNGTFTAVCSVCGAEQTEVIYAAKTIKLSKTSMTYNGKKQKPSVTITDAAGKRLKNGTDYKVTYPKKTQNVGKYTVTVTLKGNYTGTVKKTFTILPKNTAISKLTASKNTVTVKWKKQTKQTAGYEIQYSTSSKFTKKTTKTVKAAKNSMTSKKITKLKAKKKYYVRIRTYQTVKVGKKSTKIYASWSKAKTVTTKKS